MVGAGKPKRRSGNKKPNKGTKRPNRRPKAKPMTSFDGADLLLGKDGCSGRGFSSRNGRIGAGGTIKDIAENGMGGFAGLVKGDEGSNRGDMRSHMNFRKDRDVTSSTTRDSMWGNSGTVSKPVGYVQDNVCDMTKRNGIMPDNSCRVSKPPAAVERNSGAKNISSLQFKEVEALMGSGSVQENLDGMPKPSGTMQSILSAVPKPLGHFKGNLAGSRQGNLEGEIMLTGSVRKILGPVQKPSSSVQGNVAGCVQEHLDGGMKPLDSVKSNLGAISKPAGYVQGNLAAFSRPSDCKQGKSDGSVNNLPMMYRDCNLSENQACLSSIRPNDHKNKLSNLQSNLGIVFRNGGPIQTSSVGGFPRQSGSKQNELRMLAHCGNFSLSQEKSREADTNEGCRRKCKETIISSGEDDDDDDISLTGLATILKDYRPEDHDDDADDEGFIMVRRRGRRAKRDVTLTLDEGNGRGATSIGGNNAMLFDNELGKGSVVHCRKVISHDKGCEYDDSSPDDDISLKSLASILKDYRPEDHDDVAEDEVESDAHVDGCSSWVDLDDEDELRSQSGRSLTREERASLRKATEEDVSAKKACWMRILAKDLALLVNFLREAAMYLPKSSSSSDSTSRGSS
ncbi:uncharacterized protein [Palaemon carinicauda]